MVHNGFGRESVLGMVVIFGNLTLCFAISTLIFFVYHHPKPMYCVRHSTILNRPGPGMFLFSSFELGTLLGPCREPCDVDLSNGSTGHTNLRNRKPTHCGKTPTWTTLLRRVYRPRTSPQHQFVLLPGKDAGKECWNSFFSFYTII